MNTYSNACSRLLKNMCNVCTTQIRTYVKFLNEQNFPDAFEAKHVVFRYEQRKTIAWYTLGDVTMRFEWSILLYVNYVMVLINTLLAIRSSFIFLKWCLDLCHHGAEKVTSLLILMVNTESSKFKYLSTNLSLEWLPICASCQIGPTDLIRLSEKLNAVRKWGYQNTKLPLAMTNLLIFAVNILLFAANRTYIDDPIYHILGNSFSKRAGHQIRLWPSIFASQMESVFLFVRSPNQNQNWTRSLAKLRPGVSVIWSSVLAVMSEQLFLWFGIDWK